MTTKASQMAMRRVKNLLRRRNIDPAEFAKTTGFPIDGFHDNDDNEIVGPHGFLAIAKALHKPIDYFFDSFQLEEGEAQWTFKMKASNENQRT